MEKRSSTESSTNYGTKVEPAPHSPAYSNEFGDVKAASEQHDRSFNEEDLELIAHHLDDRTFDEALAIVREAVEYHSDDPCVSSYTYELLKRLAVGTPSETETQDEYEHTVKFEAFLIHEWSIYPEVRVATRPIEEEGDYAETWRVYVVGLFLACAGALLDTFFANRFPSITISSGALQLLAAGAGRMLALLPDKNVPYWPGRSFKLNPGPWCFKEQILATLTISVSASTPYALYAITSQYSDYFYGNSEAGTFGYIVILILSSSFMGFGIAGLMRTFLVYEEKCIWFSVLPTITLNRALVQADDRVPANGWKLKRFEMFWIATVSMFIWFWITNFVFQALSYFDWPSWIAPENINLQAMTGMMTGLGLNPWPTFDFNVTTNCMTVGMIAPLFATVSVFLGMVISFFAIVIIWWKNVRFTAYLPINSNSLYANDGTPFDISQVLNDNGLLDESKYQAYSLPFYSAGNLVNYGSFFMFYPAMIVYAILNYGGLMLNSCKLFAKSIIHPRRALEEKRDRFSRQIRKHNEVPEWWFLLVLVLSLVLAIVTVEHYKFTQTPVWTIFFGAALAIIFTIPTGYLYAVTGASMDINVLMELIIGYAIPGNGNALMISKVYGTNFLSQTDNYVSNQKQAHYTGLPPRSLFRLQMISVAIVCFVQAGILQWQVTGGIRDLCDPQNLQKFTCQDTRTFFNAAALWGTIGPKRVFNKLYPTIKYCFLIGVFIPIPFWAARRFVVPRFPKLNFLKNVNELLIVVGCISWAPTNFSYYIPNLYIALFFQGYVKRRFPLWWRKYNYILYNGWMVGIAYGGLILFFATEYKHVVNIDWWGNNVFAENLDYDGVGRLSVPSVGYFGPAPGTYP